METEENHSQQSSRKRKPEFTEDELMGYKIFKRFRGLLTVLRDVGDHPNRCLHYDEYAAMVVFYFFNPVITSLRDLQTTTEFEKVQRVLGIRRMSLGSMSESVRVFDPDLLGRIFEGVAQELPAKPSDPKLREIKQMITAVDGTIFPALPRMAWAVWLGDRARGAKAHVHFDILKGAPVQAQVTAGNESEIKQLRSALKPGRLYVLDRGYTSYDLFAEIVRARSSFVARLPSNTVCETLEERELTPEADAAGVTRDRIVRLGCESLRMKFDQPVRLVEVFVPESAPTGRGYAAKKVSSKKYFRKPQGEAHTLLIATDRLDLPADVIALIYRHRWKVELFFRLLKSVFGCRHLLSDSIEGVTIQVYAALLACLFLYEYTGIKPNKRVLFFFNMYMLGWAQEHEIKARLAKMKKA